MVGAVDGVDGQAVILDSGEMRTSCDDGNVGTGFMQAGGEVAADGSGAVDADLHDEPPIAGCIGRQERRAGQGRALVRFGLLA